MSWIEIYFYVGVMWNFVEVGVALKELVNKKASKRLNFTARVWRQAEIDRFYDALREDDGNAFVKCAAVLVGFFIALAITSIAWPASVFMFVRNRT